MNRHHCLVPALASIAATALLLQGCAEPGPAVPAVPVTPKEIQDTWIGKELSGSSAAGVGISVRMQADGTASLSAGSTHDTGKWRLSDNGYCATWKVVRGGQERCFTVVRSGSVFKVINPDGSPSATITSIK